MPRVERPSSKPSPAMAGAGTPLHRALAIAAIAFAAGIGLAAIPALAPAGRAPHAAAAIAAGALAGPLGEASAADQGGADPVRAPAPRVYLPRLTDSGDDGPGCITRVSVLSLGPGPTKAVLVLWAQGDGDGPPCVAPSLVRCSGLLQPGSAWDFPLTPAAGAGFSSGVLYSFTARPLSEIGVAIPGTRDDTVAADYACERLTAVLAGDCAAYSAFAAAFAAGDTALGLPLDRAAGSPLAAEVHRRCPGSLTPGSEATSAYEGIASPALGAASGPSGEYRYHAAPIHVNYGGRASALHVQNAGAAPAHVDLWLQAATACAGRVCTTLDIDPGASVVVDERALVGCVGNSWTGTVTLRSSAPLAAAVDTRLWDTLATFTATAAPAATGEAGGQGAPQRTLHGPLVFDPATGWDAEITVQNLSPDHGAVIRVTFLDAAGNPIGTQRGRLCPLDSQAFTLAMTAAQRGEGVGSVRVDASADDLTAPGTAAPPIAAVAMLVKLGDAARSTVDESLAYNLVPGDAAGAAGGAAGAAPDIPIVALPAVWKDLDAEQPTTEIAVSNLVTDLGWTDVAVLLYDQNDLVNVVCRRLGAGQTAYIDPQRMGAIHNGFRGSAVVSATYWHHPVSEIGWWHVAPTPPAPEPIRHRVALGAVAVARTGTRRGEDIPGDEAAVAIGVPLARWPDAAGLPVDPCGAREARPAAPAGLGYWQSVVPVFADAAGGTTRLSIRNDGAGPTEVRLHFQALGDCLRYRICTVGLPPRGSLNLDATRCVGPGWSGSVALHSREPLTVSAAVIGAPATQAVAGRAGQYPFDVNADGRVDDADRQAVDAARGTTPGGPGWNPRADLDANGAVDGEDLRIMRRSLCGADRDPDAAALDLPRPRGDVVYVPVLHDEGDASMCGTVVSVTNVGDTATKAVLVAWRGSVSACPQLKATACSGLLSPGSSWDFPPYMLLASTRSAVVFSFNATPLSALGAAVGGDTPAADYVCNTLFASLANDCAAYRDFKAAFDAGADFAGVPLGKAAGSAIVANVLRECQGDVTPGIRVSTAYPAVGGHQLGAPDPVTGMYETVIPLIYANKAGLHTAIHVQNAGTQETTVGIATMPQDGCSDERMCTVATIAAGAVLTIDPNRSPAPCVGRDWQGSIRLTSTQPLAAVVDLFGRDVRSTYRAVSPGVAYDAAGAPLPAGGRTMAYGPVIFSRDTGWDTGIQVQNLSRTRPAHVRVTFLDAQGTPVESLDDYICAAGSQTFFVPVQNALPERRVGSVRVVSQPYAGDPSGAPAPIAAVANLFAYSDPWRSATVAAGAYTLYAEREVVARSPGAAGATAGVGAVVIPGLRKAGAGADATSELAVANLTLVPGFTDAAVLLYDANGLADVVCRRLEAGAVDALDLGTLAGVPAGFRGSAVVSATAWVHPALGAGNDVAHNLVGLGAMAVTRRAAPAGDALSIAAGVPLARVPDALGAEALARCKVVGSPTPWLGSSTATPTPPRPTATPACPTCAAVYLPYAEQWRP